MLSSVPPFYNKNRHKMFQNILEKEMEIKPYFTNEATSILQQLLQLDPKKRLTDIQQVQKHPFFADLNFQQILNKEIPPMYKPSITHRLDLAHFDKMFTDETVKETPAQMQHLFNNIKLQNGSDNKSNHYSQFTYIKKQINYQQGSNDIQIFKDSSINEMQEIEHSI